MELPSVTLKDNVSSFSEKELSKFISSKSAEVTSILADISTQFPALQEQIKKIGSLVQTCPPFSNGVSLLDLKSQFLLSYNEYLLVYLLLKLEGIDLKDHPLFESLVRFRFPQRILFTHRTLLEKLEPLELKMKTEIDNVLNPQQETSATNPLSFRANLDDLDSGSEEEEKVEENKTKSQKYVPPKIAAVPYSERDALRDERRREELKDRIASNAFISVDTKSRNER